MKKSAQLQISFGMIFSIIIICVTLAVAIYVVVKFVDQGSNIECKTFSSELQVKLDKMWEASTKLNDEFIGSVTKKTTYICFGNISQNALTEEDKKIKEEIINYVDRKNNMFFYPKEACGENTFRYTLNHAGIDNFFCVPVSNSKVRIKLAIGSYDSKVKISE
jgi:hypothetical protein